MEESHCKVGTRDSSWCTVRFQPPTDTHIQSRDKKWREHVQTAAKIQLLQHYLFVSHLVFWLIFLKAGLDVAHQWVNKPLCFSHLLTRLIVDRAQISAHTEQGHYILLWAYQTRCKALGVLKATVAYKHPQLGHWNKNHTQDEDAMCTWGILWCCRRSLLQNWKAPPLFCLTVGWGSSLSGRKVSPVPVSASGSLWMKGSTKCLYR